MSKTRVVPERTCVGCGAVQGKRELLRLVRSADGTVSLDPSGKKNGRGAYVHHDPVCFQRAVKGRLAGCLRVTLSADDIQALTQAFEAAIALPVRRGPMVHRAPEPLPHELIARGKRGVARAAPRRPRERGTAAP